MPSIREFPLDTAALGTHMYREEPHRTTSTGVCIPEDMRTELQVFLSQFLRFIGCTETLFMRVDAFLTAQSLSIIEINVELQDGWGIALNLLRASGNHLHENKQAAWPTEIIAYNDDYLPEFELARNEFARLGHTLSIASWEERPNVPLKSPFDDKLHLAQFSRTWKGTRVHVPKTDWVERTAWDALPEDVVFKFRHKYGEQALRAHYSVIQRSRIGKGKFLREMYNAGHVVVQERMEPCRLADGSVTQAIILCADDEPITGYLQVAPAGVFVINDRTAAKGPLVFE